jgi:hypothetical protein
VERVGPAAGVVVVVVVDVVADDVVADVEVADVVVDGEVVVGVTTGGAVATAGTASRSEHFGGAAEATTTTPDHPIAAAPATAKASLTLRI